MELDFDEEQFDYVLAEIDDYARMRDELSGAEVTNDTLSHSDYLIGPNRALFVAGWLLRQDLAVGQLDLR